MRPKTSYCLRGVLRKSPAPRSTGSATLRSPSWTGSLDHPRYRRLTSSSKRAGPSGRRPPGSTPALGHSRSRGLHAQDTRRRPRQSRVTPARADATSPRSRGSSCSSSHPRSHGRYRWRIVGRDAVVESFTFPRTALAWFMSRWLSNSATHGLYYLRLKSAATEGQFNSAHAGATPLWKRTGVRRRVPPLARALRCRLRRAAAGARVTPLARVLRLRRRPLCLPRRATPARAGAVGRRCGPSRAAAGHSRSHGRCPLQPGRSGMVCLSFASDWLGDDGTRDWMRGRNLCFLAFVVS